MFFVEVLMIDMGSHNQVY